MKFFKLAALCLVIVLAAVVVAAMFFGGSMVRGAVETLGPDVLGVTVTLKGARFMPLRGQAALTGLVVGNPAGFKSPSLFELGEVSIHLDTASLFSEKIVIEKVTIEAPAITYEGSLKGSNISKLLEQIQGGEKGGGAGSGPGAEPQKKAGGGKKVVIKDFMVTDAKVTASLSELGGRGVSVVVPAVHLTDVGEDAGGVSSAEATALILKEVLKGVTTSVASSKEVLDKGLMLVEEGGAEALEAAGMISEKGLDGAGEALKKAGEGAGKVLKGVSGLLGKEKKTE
jgi:hypothetical protein